MFRNGDSIAHINGKKIVKHNPLIIDINEDKKDQNYVKFLHRILREEMIKQGK